MLVLVALIGAMLSACQFGRADPTPEPFNPPTYAPGGPSATNGVPEATGAGAGDASSDDTSEGESPSAAGSGDQDAAGAARRYSGEIEADEVVPVVAEVAGRVTELNVDVGDRVTTGHVLLRIDDSTLAAERAQALASLEAAQAQLDLLLVEADEAEIEAARAAVNAAEAAYQRALEGPTQEDLTVAESQLRQAEAAVERAQAAYDEVKWNPIIAALPESLQLQQATLQLEAAQAEYDKVIRGSTEDVIAQAYSQLAQARSQLDQLEQGPEQAQIRSAEAQVRQAETALYMAQVQLDKATVRSPIDGIVSRVDTSVGSMASTGVNLVRIISRDVKIVIRVQENRMDSLRIGRPARITVSAFPGRVFSGEVTTIAPELDTATRSVDVTVRPTEDGAGLTPGMFATVELLE